MPQRPRPSPSRQQDQESPNESPYNGLPRLGDMSNLTVGEIYQFYVHVLGPAIISSIPILLHRVVRDSQAFLQGALSKFFELLLPNWSRHSSYSAQAAIPSLRQLWEENVPQLPSNPLSETLMNHFDTNGDGHISAEEMFNMSEVLETLTHPPHHPELSWWGWFAQEWPLLDWKLGVFLYRTFGGILFLVAIFSVVPGALHGWSARLLRWPVLGLTYLLIWVELVVYTVIRLSIRVAEYSIARPKHRKLRKLMTHAQSYQEWYGYAKELDKSQKRDRWIKGLDDATSYQYNWSFIKELIKDMRSARENGDSILALAVIQQCTRLNVGGIMSADLFSYSNTGEPKHIVKEFMQEVVTTLHWITDKATYVPEEGKANETEKKMYQQNIQSEFRKEKNKLWKSLVETAECTPSDDPEGLVNDDCTETTTNTDNQSRDMDDHAEAQSPALPHNLSPVHRDQVLEFLKRARNSYGRTALCLSGGAMMGLYHFGIIRGLAKEGILPHVSKVSMPPR